MQASIPIILAQNNAVLTDRRATLPGTVANEKPDTKNANPPIAIVVQKEIA
jgi:hypothetical protein